MIIAIDPGTKTLGLAIASQVYNTAIIQRHQAIKAKVFKEDRNNWLKRARSITSQVMSSIEGLNIDLAIIEMPKPYLSEKGDAAQNSGSIIKLAYMSGMIYSLLDQYDIPILTPYAMDWKGNLPKHVTQARIKKYWGFCPEDHNAADAVGILDWYFRKYIRRNGGRVTIQQSSCT